METFDTNLSDKDQHLAALDHSNKIHSAKIKILQKELQCVKLENDVLLDRVKNTESQRNLGMPRQYQMPKSDEQVSYNSDEFIGHEDKARNDKTPNMLPASQFAFPHSKQQNINETQTNGTIQALTKQPLSSRKHLDLPSNISAKMSNDQQKTEYNKKRSVDLEEMQKQRRRQIYSIYYSTAIKPQYWHEPPTQNKLPWFDHVIHPYPGGFVLMRFDDSGYDSVNVALKSQQSICRNSGGYLLGIARKQRIFVYEIAPTNQQNWNISRAQPYSDVVTTENAVAVFWFCRKEAAEAFFDNCHHNRLREPCFPTPNGYEALYVPLNCPPPMAPYNTLFFIDFLNAHQYSEQDLTQFEGEVRSDMLREVPGCLPMVVSSSTTGRVVFKPGVLVSPYSKLFISRFESQRDVDKIWRLGVIQGLRKKWNLNGDVNVFSLTFDATF